MMAIRSIRSVRWAVALAVALLGMAFAATADAQNTRFCPPSLAPVKGGFGDRTSLGLDDGARGIRRVYEPGELIVVLRPGRTAADLRCVADELRAVVVEGGMGRRGLGSLRNAVVLQLPAGVSVQRTASRLLEPRYRRLIVTAQPNDISEVERAPDPTVEDPLFPVQWGLSLEQDGLIPKTNIDPFDLPFDQRNLKEKPFSSTSAKRRFSMRVRQAWGLLAKRPIAGPSERVRVAIVDDSLAFHPDLDENVAPDGNARYVSSGGGVQIELVARKGSGVRWRMADEWGVGRGLCPLTWNTASPASMPDPNWVAAVVSAQTDHLCDPARVPTTWRLSLDGAYRGSVTFSYDGRTSAPVDLTPLWEAPAKQQPNQPPDPKHDNVMRAIEYVVAEAAEDANGTRPVVRAEFKKPEAWDGDAYRTRELRIVLYGRSGQLTIDTARLQSGARTESGRVKVDPQEKTTELLAGIKYGTGGTSKFAYRLSVVDPTGAVAPVDYQIETSEIPADANAAVVQFRLNEAVLRAGISLDALSFQVKAIPRYPRLFSITAKHPVQDMAWIATERISVTNPIGVASDPVTARLTRYVVRGSLDINQDGTATILLAALPPIDSLSVGSTEKAMRAAIVAGGNPWQVIDPQTKWPGQMQSNSSHGQFIAGVIGAQANREGMVGVIGDQRITRTGIVMNGVLTDLSEVSTINMFDYAANALKAPVVNYSAGARVRFVRDDAKDLFDGGAGRSSDRVLQREDSLNADAMQMVIAALPDANRTLFVIAAGNDGGDVRRPYASLAVLQERARKEAESALIEYRKEQGLPAPTAEQIEEAQKKAVKRVGIAQTPCRPKGMGITTRPTGSNSKQQLKGGTLSMLRMPDGTFDRGNILCVAASDWNGELAEFSNWGPGIVDVAAPGVGIVGTKVGNYHETSDGTSYSAPMVAAVAAMIYSVIPDAQPWLVKCAILSSATSKPLQVNPQRQPYQGLTYFSGGSHKIPYPNGSPLTVSGIVQAPEAISAALHLDARVKRKLAGGWGSWPTCVQKRGTFGGWKNTPTLSVR